MLDNGSFVVWFPKKLRYSKYGNEKMIFLIGVNHEVQYIKKGIDNTKFKLFLKTKIEETKADLIAEEMSGYALKKFGMTNSVPRAVAEELGIKHLYCDPDKNQRKELGILEEKDIIAKISGGKVLHPKDQERFIKIRNIMWNKREVFWYQKLMKFRFKKCIFVFGSDHVDNFLNLLDRHNLKPHLLIRKFSV